MNYSLYEWTEEAVKRFWDYESQFPQNYFTFQCGNNLIRRFKKYFRKNARILDYGSGPGFFIPYLLRKKTRVTALEFSQNSLDIINQKFSGNQGFMGAYSAEKLVSQKLQFDTITLIEVIEHLDDHYLDITFKNIQKLLADDGILIITTPNDEDLSKSFILCPETNTLFHRWQHVRTWNIKSLRKYLEESGFRIINIGFTDFNYRFLKRTYYSIKNIIKRLLFIYPSKPPHLYCIARLGH
jgi:2-polyprenyl-3-methyl-5-hydroxy-6-metoxy-1,4-benzoquinol methylase